MLNGDRGFASMDRDLQRAIAAKGGQAARDKGTAHRWNKEDARAAGRKGGAEAQRRRRARLQPGMQMVNRIIEEGE